MPSYCASSPPPTPGKSISALQYRRSFEDHGAYPHNELVLMGFCDHLSSENM
jgi:hypothetical protein